MSSENFLIRATALFLAGFVLQQVSAADNLAVEPIPNVESLPEKYPGTWVFAHDFNFNALVDGKAVIIDVAATTRNYKGQFGMGSFGSFQHSKKNSELYSAQTFYSRGTYGERLDVLTIFDTKTLKPIDEIVLPTKRQQVVTQVNSFQLIDRDRLALVMNFTPAASVTVVDLGNRKVINEIPVPGCNFVFPTGKRGFSSLCSDGALAYFSLTADGAVDSSGRTERFIDIDTDPLFVKNATVDGITYFPSFLGRVQPIDFRRAVPKILNDWPLVPNDLRHENWRPSGWQVIAGNTDELFVLMQPDGADGSHKSGGKEIWSYSPKTGRYQRRIELETPAVSIAATISERSYLVVTNSDMALDVYDASSGEFIRTIAVGDSATPMVVHTTR